MRRAATTVTLAAVAACVPLAAARGTGPPACAPGAPAVVRTGAVTPGDARTYRLVPFDVGRGTSRVDVRYSWADRDGAPSTPLTQTVLDLGLWDADGTSGPRAFRGWSGSRHRHVFVQADRADRTMTPGPIEAGTWHVELGIAAVGPAGATWRVAMTCTAPRTGRAPSEDPVDPAHVADRGPGWYHGDLHMHGRHSHGRGPSWPSFVRASRAAGLDFLAVTEYVVGRHWDELGAAQRANPDILLWPGREIVTYFGHATTFGETRTTLEYRHGFRGVRLRDVQTRAKADGALFGVAHPTIFPGPLFANFCRGCEFQLADDIDWRRVDTLEVLTASVLSGTAVAGLPDTPPRIQQPFVDSAIDLWESLLDRGFRITAVSGSDSKGQGPVPTLGYGVNATAVYARELSRPALVEAIRAGRAYVRTRGVHDSPTVELTARAPDGRTGTLGDSLRADAVDVRVRVRGGDGQLLRVTGAGDVVSVLPIRGDDATLTFHARRSADEGPLGTWWRVDTLDARSLTTIGNPFFLTR